MTGSTDDERRGSGPRDGRADGGAAVLRRLVACGCATGRTRAAAVGWCRGTWPATGPRGGDAGSRPDATAVALRLRGAATAWGPVAAAGKADKEPAANDAPAASRGPATLGCRWRAGVEAASGRRGEVASAVPSCVGARVNCRGELTVSDCHPQKGLPRTHQQVVPRERDRLVKGKNTLYPLAHERVRAAEMSRGSARQPEGVRRSSPLCPHTHGDSAEALSYTMRRVASVQTTCGTGQGQHLLS